MQFVGGLVPPTSSTHEPNSLIFYTSKLKRCSCPTCWVELSFSIYFLLSRGWAQGRRCGGKNLFNRARSMHNIFCCYWKNVSYSTRHFSMIQWFWVIFLSTGAWKVHWNPNTSFEIWNQIQARLEILTSRCIDIQVFVLISFLLSFSYISCSADTER